LRASLYSADLHYGGNLVLHTASSGSISHLSELYLRLDDRGIAGVGEVRTNIAYLNGYAPKAVAKEAVAAVSGIDWAREPAEMLASISEWGARLIAPVRTLIDCALHDVIARRSGMSVAALLGSSEPAIAWPTNQSLFISSQETFLAQARAYVDRGFKELKVRVASGDFSEDLHRIASLRVEFGDQIKIAADANGRWSEAEVLDKLLVLAHLGLAYVEQPVAAGDWKTIDRLAEQSPIPVMLDEGVAGLDDVARICGYGGNIYAHLKLVKLGGIAPTMRGARQLASSGVPFMIGQMNEGAAATAATLHVACATSPAFAELYGADGLIDDPVSGISYEAGTVRANDARGFGITLNPASTHLIGEYGHG
jgi:L-alanine-DL-glutamate epimerase-like enolase superfamily enzyme